MAVAFDAQATAVTGTATTSFTNTGLTIGASGNALVVFLQFGNLAVSNLLVKWDNTGTPQTMTQIGTKVASDSTSSAYIFGLLAPHTGNKTLAVSWTGSIDYSAVSASFTGADQTAVATTFKNLVTDASTPSGAGDYPAPSGMAITTISGDMAVLSAASANSQFQSGSGLGTSLEAINTNTSGAARYLAAAGATTTIAAAVQISFGPCAGVGCAIAAVGNIADVLYPQAWL